ncbi:MAG: putative transcriptional regulator, partial [Solirubrobacterales bacterium]|nr:putative transcriptional regulator [Solirubrobacterales bacterium]
MSESLAGQLLIASPVMGDWFARSVVLVVEHAEEGAFGLVLNRPSESTVGEASAELGELIGGEHVLHVGGPVAP